MIQQFHSWVIIQNYLSQDFVEVSAHYAYCCIVHNSQDVDAA